MKKLKVWVLRNGFDLLIVVAATLATAFFGLVAEDVVHGTALHVILGFVFAIAVLLVYFLRRRYQRRLGTLFYARFLPSMMPDFQVAATHEARAKGQRYVPILRQFDGARDVVDLRGPLGEYLDRLAEEMDGDDRETGYTLAPNMSFPIALSAGFRFQILPNGVELAELNQDCRAAQFSFKMENVDQWQPSPSITAHPSLPDAIASGSGLIWLDIYLSTPRGELAAASPTSAMTRNSRPGGLPQAVQPYLLGSLGTDAAGTTYPQTVLVGDSNFQATSLAASVGTAIDKLLNLNSEIVVVVTARMPKTVAFAAGAFLREKRPRSERDLGRLRLLQFDEGRNKWRLLLVDDHQIDDGTGIIFPAPGGGPS